MEFSFASSGDVNSLREWLLAHPNRVNVPSAGSQYTLLFTAVNAGQLPIVTLLLDEFKADPNIPCGGIGNTAVHAAALSGNATILAAILNRGVTMKTNYYNEYPIDVAEIMTMNKTQSMREQCITMLRAYNSQKEKDSLKLQHEEEQQEQEQQQKEQNSSFDRPQSSSVVCSPVPRISGAAGHIRSTIREVRISSDRESNSRHDLSGNNTPVERDVQLFFSPIRVDTPLGDKNRIIPRNERIFSDYRDLPMDLLAFRRSFGSAFEYVETSHNLQVRGLLPYKFKGTVYYTPVILVIDKNATGGTPSRYRALINRKKMDKLFISRRATYIDPYTGAIIPRDTDAQYGGLLEFVQEVVIENFERIPPLTGHADGSKSVQESEPLFSRPLSEHDARLCILRQLSMFCDSGIGYDAANKIVSVYLTIFSTAKRSVNTIQINHMQRKNGSNVSDCKGPMTVSSTEVLMKIPVQMKFMPGGDFSDTPRVYLINATTKTTETRMNYDFLSKIIVDSTSGEVHRSSLITLTKWNQHGSLYPVLKELQMKITQLLVDYVKSDPANAEPRQSSGLNKGEKIDSGVKSCTFEDETNDWLLVSPVTSSPSTVCASLVNSIPQPRGAHEEINKCVVCLAAERTVVSLPCRHLTLCQACSQIYGDRFGDGMLCPLCRDPIEGLVEVCV